MKPIRRILVALDFDGLGDFVIEEAALLARALGASVTVLYVERAPQMEQDASRQARNALDELDTLMRAHPELEPEMMSLVASGEVWPAILREAMSRGADMIVMGTHGLDAANARPLGLSVEGVVRSSPIPVLTVPPPQNQAVLLATTSRARHHREEGMLGVMGTVSGAVTGAIAGAPGAIAGAILGAAAGLTAGKVLDNEEARREEVDDGSSQGPNRG
jgi:nucleotide-binding universal stress UspA family protein